MIDCYFGYKHAITFTGHPEGILNELGIPVFATFPDDIDGYAKHFQPYVNGPEGLLSQLYNKRHHGWMTKLIEIHHVRRSSPTLHI